MSERKFRFAGVSKRDGEFHLRASNREIYDEVLKRDKDTDIRIVKLSKPMTKDQIRQALPRMKQFKTPAILKVLRKGDEPAAAPKKSAAKRKPAAKKSTESTAQAAA